MCGSYFCRLRNLLASLTLSLFSVSTLAADEPFSPHDKTVWLKLLHVSDYSDTLSQSKVRSPSFFYSALNQSPKDELDATIEALNGRWPGITAQEAVCKFPARYLWLKNHIELSDSLSLSLCSELVKWADPIEISRISLSYVGSYLGNPASTFGHVLVRFHSSSREQENRNLLDPAINFGADVPPGEITAKYIAKGLFGGYDAGFSVQDYYRHDLVYGNTEQRDIWEYSLDLTSDQRLLLMAHLWELQDKKFDYYFLLQNCAFRISEVLEPILETDLLPKRRLSYAPVSLFEKLGNTNNPATGAPLVSNTDFIPSQQRQLYDAFRTFTKQEKRQLNRILPSLTEGDEINLEGLSNFDESQQLPALDFLVDYAQYKGIAESSRDRLLAERFKLPATKNLPQWENYAPPSDGTPPYLIRVERLAVSGDSDITRISASPFFYDQLGRHGEDGSELIFLNFTLDIDSQGSPLLSDTTLLRIRKLNSDTPRIRGESKLSWLIDAGIQRENDCNSCLEPYFSAGAGRATSFSQSTKFFVFLTANTFPERGDADISAEAGFLFNARKHGLSAEISRAVVDSTNDEKNLFRLEYRYRLNSNTEIQLRSERQRDRALSAGVSYFF